MELTTCVSYKLYLHHESTVSLKFARPEMTQHNEASMARSSLYYEYEFQDNRIIEAVCCSMPACNPL